MIDYSKSQSFGTCSTPEYVRAASEIIQNMSRNKSISPCVDFEEMVCGGWRERHYYRPNQETLFTSTLMEERSQLKLQYMLQAGYPEESKV
jgi:endothelin-converting enzyme